MAAGFLTQLIEQLATTRMTASLGGLHATGVSINDSPTAMTLDFPVGTGLLDLRIA